ncbi:MAG: ATP-binding protein [Syntrophobacteraceae bacterium]
MEIGEIEGPIVLDIPADPASLFVVRSVVGKLSERIGYDPKQTNMLILAIDEACTNVIRHAYKQSANKRIILTFLVNLDYFEITIRDFAPSSDPAQFLPRSLEDVRPGGLGIHFIKSAVDKMEFENPPDGGTILKLTKFRDKQEMAKIENPGY